MSMNISFEDLRLADVLTGKNSIMLLDPAMDAIVNSVLEQLGFDILQEIEYLPSRHRTLSGKVVIDFQAVGEMSRDSKYNHLRDVTQRTVVAGYTDASLAREMSALQGKKNSYKNDEDKWDDGSRAKKDDFRYYTEEQLLELGFTAGDEENDPLEGLYIESDWEENLRKILQLEQLRDIIRGTK